VHLESGKYHGYEALSRISKPSIIRNSEELFSRSGSYGLASSLELLCRKKALGKVRELTIPGKIFLNVCPALFQSCDHERGITATLLEELKIERSRIVFELTERTIIEDYDRFLRGVEHYREQGYSIAIDDLGSGYAGLQSLARLEPDYVKLARFLIDSIDLSSTKQALVESLAAFCNKIGAMVIAEGIERPEELEYLQSIGIHFGQGYLLGRPSDKIILETDGSLQRS
jgi:EAL domain-containing protein (putative c-di-GMP-specific phosphodiesterase class I)